MDFVQLLYLFVLYLLFIQFIFSLYLHTKSCACRKSLDTTQAYPHLISFHNMAELVLVSAYSTLAKLCGENLFKFCNQQVQALDLNLTKRDQFLLKKGKKYSRLTRSLLSSHAIQMVFSSRKGGNLNQTKFRNHKLWNKFFIHVYLQDVPKIKFRLHTMNKSVYG